MIALAWGLMANFQFECLALKLNLKKEKNESSLNEKVDIHAQQ